MAGFFLFFFCIQKLYAPVAEQWLTFSDNQRNKGQFSCQRSGLTISAYCSPTIWTQEFWRSPDQHQNLYSFIGAGESLIDFCIDCVPFSSALGEQRQRWMGLGQHGGPLNRWVRGGDWEDPSCDAAAPFIPPLSGGSRADQNISSRGSRAGKVTASVHLRTLGRGKIGHIQNIQQYESKASSHSYYNKCTKSMLMILISLKANTWVLLGLVIHDASSLSIKAKATTLNYVMKNYLWMKQICLQHRSDTFPWRHKSKLSMRWCSQVKKSSFDKADL